MTEGNGAAFDGDIEKDSNPSEMTVGKLVDQHHLRNNRMDVKYVDTDTEMESDNDNDSQVTILTCDSNFLDLLGKPGKHMFKKTRLENRKQCHRAWDENKERRQVCALLTVFIYFPFFVRKYRYPLRSMPSKYLILCLYLRR